MLGRALHSVKPGLRAVAQQLSRPLSVAAAAAVTADQKPTIYTSPRPNVTIPKQDLYSFIFDPSLSKHAHRTASVDGVTGEQYSFAELQAKVDALAAGLTKLGLKKDDVVGIFAPNHIEFGVVFLATARLGAVLTTANPTYTAEELKFQLEDTKAKFLVTLPELLPTAVEAAKGTAVQALYVLGPNEVSGKAKTVTSLFSSASSLPKIPEFDPAQQDIVLPYSSGTTGQPKGTQLTHTNLVANMLQHHDILYTANNIDPLNESNICTLPLYHIYGMTVLLNSYRMRQKLVYCGPKFDMVQFMLNIQKHKVTTAYIVPPIVIGLIKSGVAAKFDVSSLKYITSGAAPLTLETLAEWHKDPILSKIDILQGYGMTEMSPISHFTYLKDNVPGSIGRIVANCEGRVVEPGTLNDVAPGEEGELLVRGPNVMKGYLNNPAATKNAITEDNFLHTGDVVKVDAKGNFFVTDRMKELIKYKGLQVAPAQLEGLLLSHPEVVDAAVVPQAHPEAGEVPKAFVVLKAGVVANDATAQGIANFITHHVAPHKKLRGGVEFIEAIPKSASGKILRRVLKAKNDDAIKKAKTSL